MNMMASGPDQRLCHWAKRFTGAFKEKKQARYGLYRKTDDEQTMK
jgi:hypothetical protein